MKYGFNQLQILISEIRFLKVKLRMLNVICIVICKMERWNLNILKWKYDFVYQILLSDSSLSCVSMGEF